MVAKCNQPILTITGSDGTGESGVQADIKTMTALGGRAVSAITSITIQNTLGIQQIFDLPAQVVGAQIEAIVNDVEPQVVKIGMIRNVAVLGAIADVLGKYHPQYMVYDPVVSSSRGDTLMDEDVIAQVKNRLLPLCSVVVVKKQDAAAITHREIGNADDAHLAIEQLKAYGCEEVLLLDDEKSLLHGQNNSLASAIAVFLCQGCTKEEAIDKARTFVGQQVMRADNLAGRSSELYNDFLDKVARHYHTNSDVHFFAGISTSSSPKAPNGVTTTSASASCSTTGCLWACNFPLPASASSCSRVPTTRWAPSMWPPSRLRSASSISSPACSKTSAWPWPPTADRTSGPMRCRASRWGCARP